MVIHVQPRPGQPAPAEGDGAPVGPPRTITYLRISVTDRCNLRCVYCMPEDQSFLGRDHLLTYEELTEVARVLVGLGIRKIRLTGGEPLLRRDMVDLVAMLRGLDETLEITMTTNGMLLERYALALKQAGLDRLNISLDTLRPERFERLSRRKGLEATLRGVDAVLEAGFERTKTNMVVMGGINDDEVGDMLDFARARGIEQRFIEFMPLASNQYGVDAERVPVGEIKRRIVERAGAMEERARGSDPAQRFELPDGSRVGVIAAISLPFCETCNRVRLTADGRLRSCLFEGGEVAIRDLVRSGVGVADGLERALEHLRRVKPPVHDGVGHVQMNQVGG